MRVGIVLLFGIIAACSSPSSEQSTADAAPEIDAGLVASCTHEGFTLSNGTAERDGELDVLFYSANSGQVPALQRLTLDFYFGLGAKRNAHDLNFSGEGLDTCSTCLIVRRECTKNNCSGGRAFSAQSGKLQITALGDTLQGSLTDVVLAEVDIAVGSLKTTLVPQGQTWCIDQYDFDQAVSP